MMHKTIAHYLPTDAQPDAYCYLNILWYSFVPFLCILSLLTREKRLEPVFKNYFIEYNF